jgi:hydrogenase maturation protein HypF
MTLKGIVQGVGFRPFVYRLATEHQLVGSVSNHSGGVRLVIQGEAVSIDRFIETLIHRAPPLSRIDALQIEAQELQLFTGFFIVNSQPSGAIGIAMTPDQGMCPACCAELYDASSRFYRYPLTNCSHCGPRYTITQALPYDRANTSMHGFTLCDACRSAYLNPMDRRYHAQPISCPKCGPQLRFLGPRGHELSSGEGVLVAAVDALRLGEIIAVKGMGGFHLACDARQPQAVARLRQMKRRAGKPLAVMVPSVAIAQALVEGEYLEWQALQSQASPIVLMRKRLHILDASESPFLADNVAPNVPYLGVMLAYTPLHHLLLAEFEGGLVMTSANRSGQPIATQADAVLKQFMGAGFAGLVDHNRPILQGCDDSVVHLAAGKIRVLRLARGYAPYHQYHPGVTVPTLAMGAQQKAAIGLALGDQWLVSPFIGDIDDLDTFDRYQSVLENFQRLYRLLPSQRVCDSHPGYVSTQWAARLSDSESDTRLLKVGHHHAHILAVMAEHQLTQPVLGFAFDGTGWGDDQTVWGGEVLLCTVHAYQRVFRLRGFRLLGGEAAIKEPARVVLAMLLECYGLEAIKQMGLAVFQGWSDARFDNLYQMWSRGTHSPYTSSMGRLIDGLACLLGRVDVIDFEGESGLRIEQAALRASYGEPMAFNLESGVIDWQPLLEQALRRLGQDGGEASVIDACCRGLLEAVAKCICTIARRYQTQPVVLGGGVFQNRWLLNEVARQAEGLSQPLFTGEKLPVNDGGIAAGQLWYALHQDHRCDASSDSVSSFAAPHGVI